VGGNCSESAVCGDYRYCGNQPVCKWIHVRVDGADLNHAVQQFAAAGGLRVNHGRYRVLVPWWLHRGPGSPSGQQRPRRFQQRLRDNLVLNRVYPEHHFSHHQCHQIFMPRYLHSQTQQFHGRVQ